MDSLRVIRNVGLLTALIFLTGVLSNNPVSFIGRYCNAGRCKNAHFFHVNVRWPQAEEICRGKNMLPYNFEEQADFNWILIKIATLEKEPVGISPYYWTGVCKRGAVGSCNDITLRGFTRYKSEINICPYCQPLSDIGLSVDVVPQDLTTCVTLQRNDNGSLAHYQFAFRGFANALCQERAA